MGHQSSINERVTLEKAIKWHETPQFMMIVYQLECCDLLES